VVLDASPELGLETGAARWLAEAVFHHAALACSLLSGPATIRLLLQHRENRLERLPELAAELVRLDVELIIASGTLGPLAAKRATLTIPIAMTASGDSLGSGLIANLAHPGSKLPG
jgi:ABC-type uncharacterized transport system substrate-binding protein